MSARKKPSKMTSQSYCALLLLCTVASSFLPLATGTQCVDSLPDFRNTGHLQREGLSNGIAAVIPAYNFSCTGRVKQWRAHVERRRNRYDRYKLTFSVWRQTSSSDDCEYQLVGENAHSGLAPELGDNDTALGTVTLNVSAEEQIVVRPGDFVGFKVEHYEVAWPSGRWLGAGAASIMVDLEQTNVLVWNKQLPFDQTCLRERDLDRETEHYSGVFEPTPLPAAPVITVMVESVAIILPTTTITQGPTSSPATSPPVTSSPSSASLHSPVSSASPPSPAPNPDVTKLMPLTTIIVLVLVLCVLLMVAILVMLAIIFCVRRRFKTRSKRNVPSPTDSEMFENRVYFHNKSLCSASNKLQDNKSPSCREFSNAMYDAPLTSSSRSTSNSTETLSSYKETSFHKPNPSATKAPAEPNDYLRVYNALSPSPPLVRAYTPPSMKPPIYDTIPASSHVYDIPSTKKAGSMKRDHTTTSSDSLPKCLDVQHSPIPSKREGSALYETVPMEDVQDGNEAGGAGEMADGEEAEKMGMGGYEYMASAMDLTSPSSASQNDTPLYDSIKLI